MKYYKNNLEGLDKLREVLELSLRLILENIESSQDEENLKELEIVKEDDVLSIGEFANLLRLKGVPFGRNTVDGPIETETIYLTSKGIKYFMKKILSEFNIKES